jgi:ligand-binding SRPBCC domain-containing protein
MEIQINLQTCVSAPISEVWNWITSVKGISKEMWPYFKMTTPRGITGLQDITFEPGKRLFRSRIYLFGFIPFGFDDMTLLELNPDQGFIEQSPMAFMNMWRHERSISSSEDGTWIMDHVTFEPRHAVNLVAKFMKRVFIHRHKVIKQNLDRKNKIEEN